MRPTPSAADHRDRMRHTAFRPYRLSMHDLILMKTDG